MPQKRLLSFSLFHTHFCLTRACRTQMNQCVNVCWMLCCYYCFIFNNEFEIRCIYIESNFIIWCVWMCSPVLLMIGRPFERWIHWIEKIKTEAKNQFAFVLTISVVDLCTDGIEHAMTRFDFPWFGFQMEFRRNLSKTDRKTHKCNPNKMCNRTVGI